MMNRIINDLFIGWKTAHLGRMRYFFYSLLITGIKFTGLVVLMLVNRAAEANKVSVPVFIFSSFLLLCTFLLCIYCGLLTLTKRIRDLGIDYSITVAIIVVFADIKFWDLLDSVRLDSNADVWFIIRVITITLIILVNMYILFGGTRRG